jgi:hypothetical protein
MPVGRSNRRTFIAALGVEQSPHIRTTAIADAQKMPAWEANE